MFNNKNLVILYICNKKMDCAVHCQHNRYYECKRTLSEKYARYGKCDGHPSWYPERFYKDDRRKDIDLWIEKERC